MIDEIKRALVEFVVESYKNEWESGKERMTFYEPVEENEEERVIAALAYLLGPVGAICFYLIKEKDRFVRFHAIQSILFWLSGIFFVLILILGIVTISLVPVFIMLFVGWLVYLMYHAERGEWIEVPFIGNFAEENC
ncbi:MAG: hypothetical protein QXW70_04275 [Candidatus Anstonellales archaeon]